MSDENNVEGKLIALLGSIGALTKRIEQLESENLKAWASLDIIAKIVEKEHVPKLLKHSERLDTIERCCNDMQQEIDYLKMDMPEVQERLNEAENSLDKIEGQLRPKAKWRSPNDMPDAPIEKIGVDKKDLEAIRVSLNNAVELHRVIFIRNRLKHGLSGELDIVPPILDKMADVLSNLDNILKKYGI